jgi:hypothetical protein
MADQTSARFRVDVKAPANGRIRQADILVYDGDGKMMCTDRGDLMAQDQLARVAKRLSERLCADFDQLFASLEARWAEMVAQRLRQEETGGGADAAKEPSPVDMLLELAEAADYFHGNDGKPYATVPLDEDGGRVETMCLRAEAFKDWLRRRYYVAAGRAASADTLQTALGVLVARANFDGPARDVFVRVAGTMGTMGTILPVGCRGPTIYIDLGDEARRCVEVDASGWRILDKSPVRFRRPRGQLPLPEPVRGGSVDDLYPLLNVREDDWSLVLAWIAQAFCPWGPYPSLNLHGEQGTAKTTLARVLKRLVDPSKPPLRKTPREQRDLAIAATNCWVLAMDNLSHLQTWLSDDLCGLSTGGGLATRALYTDEDECLFDFQRPVILTGIEDLAERPDLLDRSIVLILEAINPKDRISERDYWSRVEAVLPGVFGAVLDGLSGALRLLPAVAKDVRELPRMADFGLWCEAFGRALGWHPGTVLAAYNANRDEAAGKALDASILTNALRLWLEKASEEKKLPWEGACAKLLEELTPLAGDAAKDRSWPKTPQTLSGHLRRLAPVLRSRGVTVELDIPGGRGSEKKRLVRISWIPPDPRPATASPSSPPSPKTDGEAF